MSDEDEKHTKFILRQHNLKHGVNQDKGLYRQYDKLFNQIFQNMQIGEKDPESTRNEFIQQMWYDDSLNRSTMDRLVKGYGIGPEANPTDAASKFVKDDPLQLAQAYESFKRDGSHYTDGKFRDPEVTAKPILRSRFIMPGENSVAEPLQQTIQDVVNSDLFAFVPNDGGVGVANSLFIDNAKHEETVRFAEPLLAARRDDEDAPHLLGSIEGIKQFPHTIQQVDNDMRAIIDEQVSQMKIEHSNPGLSIGIKPDNLSYIIDPFGLPRKHGFMMPVHTRQSEYAVSASNPYSVYRQDTSTLTPFGLTEALGFKRSTNTWREPLVRESDPSIPWMTPEEQMHKINHQGHDLFY